MKHSSYSVLQTALSNDLESFKKKLDQRTLYSEKDHRVLLEFLYKMQTLVKDVESLNRSRPLAHFTASAFIVNPLGQPLALFHKKLQRWLQPGGHLESQDQSPLHAALREATEESQLPLIPLSPLPIDLDIHFIPQRSTEDGHDHYDLRFAFLTLYPDQLKESHESEGHIWLKGKDLESWLKDDSIRRAYVSTFTLLRDTSLIDHPPSVQGILDWDQSQVDSVFGEYGAIKKGSSVD